MTMEREFIHDATGEVVNFFEQYRSAFERLDHEAIVERFAYPCHVTGDGPEISIHGLERDQWKESVRRLIGMYRELDVASVDVLQMEEIVLSPRLRVVRIRWDLHDSSGSDLYRFGAVYTLAMIAGRFAITAIAHDELIAYRACVARRGHGKRPPR